MITYKLYRNIGIVIMKKLDTRRILTISDQHAPYEHPDMLAFLKAIKKKYNPTLVINGGDEVDAHALSFHDSDSDLPSAGDELELAIKKLKKLEALFPSMLILDSNHGSLAARKFKHHGIPMKYLATPQQLYGVSNKWQWINDLTVKLPNGQDCYFAHGMVKDGKKLATSMIIDSKPLLIPMVLDSRGRWIGKL